MSDEIAVLKLVAGRLAAAGIDYMVTGSLALSAYAVPRMTRDIDLVVALEPEDASLLCQVLGDEFDCDEAAVRAAIVRGSPFNLIHTARVVKVDFVVRKGTRYRPEGFSRRRVVDIDGQSIWIVSPEDLLLSKLLWGKGSDSAVQRGDVTNLMASSPLDWPYIERWADELGLRPTLEELRKE